MSSLIHAVRGALHDALLNSDDRPGGAHVGCIVPSHVVNLANALELETGDPHDRDVRVELERVLALQVAES